MNQMVSNNKLSKLNENKSVVSKWNTAKMNAIISNLNKFQLTVNSPVIASNPT